MSAQKKVIYCCLACALGLGLFLTFTTKHEPTYEGKNLTWWTTTMLYPYGSAESASAIRAMGTNTLPFLLQWIQHGEDRNSFWQRSSESLEYWFFGPKYMNNPALQPSGPWVRAEASILALQMLRGQARPLIPELTRLGAGKSPFLADRSLRALAAIGGDGLPSLLAGLQNPTHPHREEIVSILGWALVLESEWDTNSFPLPFAASLQALAPGSAAARVLGGTNPQPATAISALMIGLGDANPDVRGLATMSLIWFGSQSQRALPLLTNLQADSDAIVRREATNAIRNISVSIQKKASATNQLSPHRIPP